MTQYAHTAELTPRPLPTAWTAPNGRPITGLAAMSDAERAALGWYPVRREPLEPGASGYGEMELIGSEFVIPSLPGDPEVAERQRIDELTVTALQGMLAIEEVGLTQEFVEWKSGLDPVADFKTLAFLEKATTWRYDNPIIDDGLTALNVFDQKAALFALARTL